MGLGILCGMISPPLSSSLSLPSLPFLLIYMWIGAIGFIGTSVFVRKIYKNVKIE
jgi:hypothetical protein